MPHNHRSKPTSKSVHSSSHVCPNCGRLFSTKSADARQLIFYKKLANRHRATCKGTKITNEEIGKIHDQHYAHIEGGIKRILLLSRARGLFGAVST
jgi:hypothetical protein